MSTHPVQYIAVVSACFTVYLTGSVALAAQPCGKEKVDEVRASATTAAAGVLIDCDLTLEPHWIISKHLTLEGLSATGVTVDCNNATLNGGKGTPNYKQDMIQVRSKEHRTGLNTVAWERPEDIVIKNCRIEGSVRVLGMASEFQLISSSRSPDHTNVARNNAPTRVRFENMTITGVGRNPFYVAIGVTHTQLLNSKIDGRSDAVAVYLDAESAFNTIKGNRIEASVSHAVLAIDGSSHNTIIDNRFSGLEHGGVYLYRNCGEPISEGRRGIARHATPSHNIIVNNIFYYKEYKGGNPSVYLGSRNGKTRKGNFGYCGDDNDARFGSGVSNLDFANENIVMQNQIVERFPNQMIKSKNWINNSPNYIGHNQKVTKEEERLAGCFVPNGSQETFIAHGASVEGFEIQETANGPRCERLQYSCSDGAISSTRLSACDLSKVPFDCRASGTNVGCRKSVACPTAQRIAGAVAACNLEFGLVSDSALAAVRTNHVQVLRPSDDVWDGFCSVGDNQLRDGNSVRSGHRLITGISGQSSVIVACREHDENGGDCHIRGNLYCRKLVQ